MVTRNAVKNKMWLIEGGYYFQIYLTCVHLQSSLIIGFIGSFVFSMLSVIYIFRVCFIPKAVAIALYSGLETCLVVDSGADNTVVTPVVDSLALTTCVQHLKIGGTHLTHQLLTCLSTKGIDVEVSQCSTYFVCLYKFYTMMQSIAEIMI